MSIGHNRSNHAEQARLTASVEAYLAQGGQIQQVESGHSVDAEKWRTMTAQERYLSSGSTMGVKLARIDRC